MGNLQSIPVTVEVRDNSQNAVKRMLDDGILTDIVIKTKDKELHCHKVILASKSEFFRAKFETMVNENDLNSFRWTNMNSMTIEALIDYIYTGEIPPDHKEYCFDLLQVAHICKLQDLKEECATRVCNRITVDNAVTLLKLGEEYDCDKIRTTAVEFAIKHGEAILESTEFEKLKPEDGLVLLKTFIKCAAKNN